MPTPTAEQSRALAKEYSELASAFADYRFTSWDELNAAQRAEIESQEWTLRRMSSEMANQAIHLTVEASGSTIAEIARAVARLKSAVRHVAEVKRALTIAAAAVTLGSAIAGENALAIGEALRKAWSAAEP